MSLSGQPKRRVVIAAGFADDNRGIAALTHAAIEDLRQAFPECRISMIAVENGRQDAHPFSYTMARHPDIEVLPPLVGIPTGPLGGLRAFFRSLLFLLKRPGKASPAIERTLGADLVVCRGGYHSFKDRPGLGGVVSMWLTTFPIILGNRFGIPTVILPSAIGPFRHWPSRLLSGWILGRAALVLVRDQRSYREVLSLGVHPARVVQVPDGVFAHRAPSAAECETVAARLGFGGARFAAMTVRYGSGTPDQVRVFLDNLRAVVRLLLDRGTVDQVAIVVQVDGRFASDAEDSSEFARLVNDPRVRLVTGNLSPDDLVAFYGAAVITIACRLHSSIFSLVAGTPAFCFSMAGTKTEGVFEGLGLADFVVPCPRFDPRVLANAVEKAVNAGESLRGKIRQSITAARAQAERTAGLIRSVIEPDGKGSGLSASLPQSPDPDRGGAGA
jgi:polysaccharide pyruvyl transferase WcaK-like protein